MKTLTVKREGTSTEFSYEIVWDAATNASQAVWRT